MSRKLSDVYRLVGSSNHTVRERAKNDFYASPPHAIDALIIDGGAQLSELIWEPACGDGALSKRLEDYGYEVLSTDIEHRGYGVGGVDFLLTHDPFDGDIVTNPPYILAQGFIEHGLEIIGNGHKVFVLLRLMFLEGQKRRSLFKKRCLKTVYVFSKRITCYNSGEYKNYSGAVAFAWFEFEKGYSGDPIIKWIN